MDYKIVIDSSGELTEEMKASGAFTNVALAMDIDGHHIIDDETFDQASFLKMVADSPNCPKSSCPSPEAYMKEYCGEAKRVYAITLSAELSGSYNSAVLGKNLYQEEYGDKDIYVFNSRSASIGQSLIGLKIWECEEAGMSFQEVIDTVEQYIETQHTYFVLESLEAFRKNGRLKGVKLLAATVLNIKLILGSTPEGNICQLGQERGMKKAMAKMADLVTKGVVDPEEKVLAISHCNCPERAEQFKKLLEERNTYKEIIILNMRGISSMYASDGGLICVV